MEEVKIAVKELAFKLYASGDLSSEFFYNHDENEAIIAHQHLQNNYNKESFKEYHIERKEVFKNKNFIISGIMDGLLKIDKEIIIEEIKSTKRLLKDVDEFYHEEYLAQLKLYMAIYALNNNLKSVHGRLTFIKLQDYETKSIDFNFSYEELKKFYYESLDLYLEWLDLFKDEEIKNKESLKNLRFPYKEYRPFQQDFMKAVFKTLKDGKILYGVAPTGIGKTISVLYPSLKTLKKENEKIFYLTAKDTLKKQVINTISLMQDKGLTTRLLELSSKEKMCKLKTPVCTPENCPYASGYFKRLNIALKEVLKKEKLLTSEKINEYADKYLICPFEFSLSLTNYSSLILGDYNYVFDPKVKLIRYFSEDNDYKVKVLVDEAHNLVSRSKEMYSHTFKTDSLLIIKRVFKDSKVKLNPLINKILKYLDDEVKDKLTFNHLIKTNLDSFLLENLNKLSLKISHILEEFDLEAIKKHQKGILEYLELNTFLKLSTYYGSTHRFIILKNDETYSLKILCLDAANFLSKDIKEYLHGIVFFSATLTPLDYYKRMLTNNEGEHIILPSIFPQKNFDLIFEDHISTFYKDRLGSVEGICESLEIMVHSSPGNYIVFFPSYEYLLLVYDELNKRNFNTEVIIQEKLSSVETRNKVLALFDDIKTPKVGFFVMGGIYAEGIDFIGDKLKGVIIVGVGLPQINYENELLKTYFDNLGFKGFDYAYTYPGFNKVLQASGRVIRSMTDKGVTIIIDKRITRELYLNLLPSNFKHFKTIRNNYALKNELEKFWNID